MPATSFIQKVDLLDANALQSANSATARVRIRPVIHLLPAQTSSFTSPFVPIFACVLSLLLHGAYICSSSHFLSSVLPSSAAHTVLNKSLLLPCFPPSCRPLFSFISPFFFPPPPLLPPSFPTPSPAATTNNHSQPPPCPALPYPA